MGSGNCKALRRSRAEWRAPLGALDSYGFAFQVFSSFLLYLGFLVLVVDDDADVAMLQSCVVAVLLVVVLLLVHVFVVLPKSVPSAKG